MFKSLLINKTDDRYSAQLAEIAESELPQGDVEVIIDYSSINYKDALAITGRGPIVRHFPMVPGIDFAGTVSASSHPEYQAGDKVLLTGWGVGEKHWGGLSEKARVKGDWLTLLPTGANSKHVMAIGTAGFTAMLCGLAPIFPYTFYHLTHYWFAAADIPVANDTPVHYADAIRCNVRRPPQGSLPLLTRRVSA